MTTTPRRLSLVLTLASCLLATTAMVPSTGHAARGDNEASTRFINDAREQIRRGDLNAAVIQLKNAIQRAPESVEARKLLAEIYLRLGQGAAAEKEVRAALRAGGTDKQLPILLGNSLLLQRQFDELLREISDDTVDPEVRADAIVLRARAYLGLGQRADAEKAFDAADKIRPNDGGVKIGRAQILLVQGKLDEAEREVDQAIAAQSDLVEAHVIKGEIRRLYRDNDASLASFTKALQLNAAHVAARVGKASALIELNRVPEAQRDLDEVFSRSPRNPAASYLQGLIFARNGQFQQAQDFLNQGGGALDNHLPSVFLRGVVAYQLNQLEQAESHLVRYLQSVPGNPRAAKILAATHMRKGQPQRAIDLLKPIEEALQSDPQALSILGAAYMRVGRYGEGADYYERATTIDPSSAGIRTQLAMSRLATGQAEKAEDELEKALQIDPDARQAAVLLALVQLRNRDFDGALESAKKLQDQQKDNPIPPNLMGAALLGKGDRDGARREFENALKIKSDFHPARLNLAQIALADGDVATGTKHYEEILRQTPNHTGAMLALSEIAVRQDKRREAMDWLQRAMQADSRAIAAPLRLAMMHAQGGNFERALATAREVDRNVPNNTQVIETIGRIEMAAKQPDAAVSTFNRLAILAPTSPQAQEYMARAYLESRDPVKARSALRRAIELDQTYFPAYAALFDLEVQQNDFAAARSVATRMREIKPDLGVGDMLIGDILMREKKYADALKFYDDGLKREVSPVLALRRFAAQREMGKMDDALRDLRQWVEKNDDKGARFALSSAYIEAGKTEDAIRETERLHRTDGKNPVLLNNLAWLYHQKKDPRALALAEEAYKEAPQSANIVDTLGWILLETGDAKRGLDLISKAYNLNPNSGEIHYHLAVALNRNGFRDEAKKELEKLIRSGATFSKVFEARALLRELGGSGG